MCIIISKRLATSNPVTEMNHSYSSNNTFLTTNNNKRNRTTTTLLPEEQKISLLDNADATALGLQHQEHRPNKRPRFQHLLACCQEEEAERSAACDVLKKTEKKKKRVHFFDVTEEKQQQQENITYFDATWSYDCDDANASMGETVPIATIWWTSTELSEIRMQAQQQLIHLLQYQRHHHLPQTLASSSSSSKSSTLSIPYMISWLIALEQASYSKSTTSTSNHSTWRGLESGLLAIVLKQVSCGKVERHRHVRHICHLYQKLKSTTTTGTIPTTTTTTTTTKIIIMKDKDDYYCCSNNNQGVDTVSSLELARRSLQSSRFARQRAYQLALAYSSHKNQ